jgi:hypothetical protein
LVDDLKTTVAKLTAQLGDSKFKTREAATAQLIAIGKAKQKCKASGQEAGALVAASMKGCARHKDPEVRERAKRVLLALTPPVKVRRPPRQILQLDGDVAIEAVPVRRR